MENEQYVLKIGGTEIDLNITFASAKAEENFQKSLRGELTLEDLQNE